MRKLLTDPWAEVAKKYDIGQKITGKVLKINPFGLFVELDTDIHGLAHISELSDKPITDMSEIATIGEDKEFTIISIEPDQHRLGLSLRGPRKAKPKKEAEKKPEKDKKEEAPVEEKKDEGSSEEKPDEKAEEKK